MKKLIHFVSGGWNGDEFVRAICGEWVSCFEASSLFTDCPNCLKKRQAQKSLLE